MGSTSWGLRYPENTDRVIDGAAAIQQLAEDVDADLTGINNKANAAQADADRIDGAALGGIGRTKVPHAQIYRSSALAIPHNTSTDLGWNAWGETSGDSFDAGGAGLRAPISGLYLATVSIIWAGNATGVRQADLVVGSSAKHVNRVHANANQEIANDYTYLVRVAAAEIVSVRVAQTSGGSLNVQGSTSAWARSGLQLLWVAP